MFQKFQNYLNGHASEVFTLDTRSLAVLRIVLGLATIYNLASLWPRIDDFYGPHGIFPSAFYFQDSKAYIHWSFHALSDTPNFIKSIFIFHALCACMLIAGYRTRLATFLCWLMTISLINRVPLINYGADKVLVSFLMWGLFLPLGACCSIDQLKTKNQHLSYKTLSIASTGLICHLIIIYLTSGWSKTSPIWTKDFSAFYFILKSNIPCKPLGDWLLQFPFLLKTGAILTLALERYIILFLFLPIWTSVWRNILICCFILFHLGIFLTMDVGWLSWIMIGAWMTLIPPVCWQWLKISQVERPIIHKKNPRNILLKGIAAATLTFISIWNFQTMSGNSPDLKHMSTYAINFAQMTGLYQSWKFFSPGPFLYFRHYYFLPVFDHPLSNPNDTSKFHRMTDLFEFLPKRDDRWIKFIFNLSNNQSYKRFIPYFKTYLVYYWNKIHPQGPRATNMYLYYWDDPISPHMIKVPTQIDPFKLRKL